LALGFLQFVGLGAFAGFTIFLGLPIALIERFSPRTKGFLNALAIGILVFLVSELVPQAQQISEGAIRRGPLVASVYVLAVVGGLALGLLSLVFYEWKFLRQKNLRGDLPSSLPNGGSIVSESNRVNAIPAGALRGKEREAVGLDPTKVALMIAGGIGIHNFSEGLAMGQEYAGGYLAIALLLVIGFALHNATEGFGIAAPLIGLRPKSTFLGSLGLLGGGPTFLGTVIGSFWTSDLLTAFVLAIASGALVYVIMALYGASRKQTTNAVMMLGIFFGLLLGFFADLLLVLAGV
jgi:ZIP family zinc transporter